LEGGELYYFEINQSSNLVEVEKTILNREVSCLSIIGVPEDRQRARFLAVGLADSSLNIYSLESDDVLQQLSAQVLQGVPSSVCLLDMQLKTTDVSTLYLNVGMTNGIFQRSVVDTNDGSISDTRRRFLGASPVKLFPVKIRGLNAVLALAGTNWVCYPFQSRFETVPLAYVPLESASAFCSAHCPEGIVGFSGNMLRIISIERLGNQFNQTKIPMLHTPRRFITVPNTDNLIISIESDHNSSNSVERRKVQQEEKKKATQEEEPSAYQEYFVDPRPGKGKWASAIRVLDIVENKTLELIELQLNESAISVTTCVFKDRNGKTSIVIGTAKDMILQPRSYSGGYIHVYELTEKNTLALIHKTEIDHPPTTICGFKGKLLVGCSNVLRIYEYGKKKLLRKTESKAFPHLITNIKIGNERIYVSDISESVFFC